jgi:hypothetical protein
MCTQVSTGLERGLDYPAPDKRDMTVNGSVAVKAGAEVAMPILDFSSV